MKMSLRREPIGTIPEETVRAAQGAFPKGNPYLRMRDELGLLFEEADFKVLYPRVGQPAIPAWRLMLVSIMQFAEDLSDRQAAEAVRDRIAWKYALGLELTDEGFDFSVLSEFRTRLIEGQAETHLMDVILARFKQVGLLKERGQQRTDSTHVLAVIRALNRSELVAETLRATLNVLAVIVPDWLRTQAPLDWYERYRVRFEESRLPVGEKARMAWVKQLGADGQRLLAAIQDNSEFHWLFKVPAVQTLQTAWQQQYSLEEQTLRWRPNEALVLIPDRIASPYDVQARYATKSSTTWTGYKVHLTESCDPEQVHLITDVQTTLATVSDIEVLPAIHAQLEARDLLPNQQLVDTGYISAEMLRQSRAQYGVDLVGPTHPDTSWQAQRMYTAFDLSSFQIDFERQQATCPEGKTSQTWSQSRDRAGNSLIRVRFKAADCGAYRVRLMCTHATARTLSFQPKAEFEALQEARWRERTPEFKALYARRAGVEGTHSQGVRVFGLRRSRYIGLARTHLDHVLTAMAINVPRAADWLAGIEQAKTRRSAFAALTPELSAFTFVT
jgi:transposase